MSGGVRHGFSGAWYRSLGDGRVEVTSSDGVTGIFDRVGRWLEGELYDVDPQMCIWVGGTRIAASHRLSAQVEPAEPGA
jgi:hypothetical protein